jgi:hypothetical protein
MIVINHDTFKEILPEVLNDYFAILLSQNSQTIKYKYEILFDKFLLDLKVFPSNISQLTIFSEYVYNIINTRLSLEDQIISIVTFMYNHVKGHLLQNESITFIEKDDSFQRTINTKKLRIDVKFFDHLSQEIISNVILLPYEINFNISNISAYILKKVKLFQFKYIILD